MEKFVLVGEIVGAHGIKGAVRLRSFTDPVETIFSYSCWTDESERRQFEAKKWSLGPKGFIVYLDGVTDRNHAESLAHTELFVRRDELGQLDDDQDEFYHADIIGMSVIDSDGNLIGVVKQISNFGAGDLLEVELIQSSNLRSLRKHRFFLPFTQEVVPTIDLSEKRLTLSALAEAFFPEKD